ncbi:hypothetical protein ACFL6S_26810 [Candidatus Poribacteria bacterium]
MNIKAEITLTGDDYTEEARKIQVQIWESILDGFWNLLRATWKPMPMDSSVCGCHTL